MRAGDRIFASKRSQLAALVAVWLFSSFLCSRFLFTSGSLYLDHLRLYSYSYDNLHALNWFGEPAWWFPHNQGGVPGYVYSQLGVVNAGTPLSALVGGAFWLLGALGIHVASLHAFYVVYHFWLLPAVLLVAVWLCARQLFHHGLAIVFVLVLTAFSPAILQNLKDPGFVEITAYGLYFVAAWLHLLRAPARPSALWAVVVSACVAAVSIGFSFLIWNVYLLPLIVIVPLVVYPPARRGARRLIAVVPRRRWLIAAIAIALCAVPKLVVLHQSGDLVRANVEQHGYSFDKFRPGNPWQVLLSGVPAVGFGNTSATEYPLGFIVMPTPLFFHSSYLGVLALPLAVFGLVFARPGRRLAMFAFAAIGYLVVLLSANSPLLAPLLMPETPFRSANHFFDIYYGFGGSFLLVFAAGLGLDTFVARPEQRRWLLRLYGATLAGSSAVFCALFPDRIAILGSLFGFYVLAAGLLAIALVWIVRARAAVLRQAWYALICMAAIDVATIAWHTLKANLASLPGASLDEPRADHVGLVSPDANSAADTAFLSRSLRDLVQVQHLDLQHLPDAALFARAHLQSRPTQADVDQAASPGPGASLALAVNAAREPAIQALCAADAAAPPPGQVASTAVSYNTRELTTDTAAPAMLFLRTPFSLYWRATIDGEPVRVVRALGQFSAVAVPAGRHAIRLAYAPTGVGSSLMFAWLIIAGLAGVAVATWRRERRSSMPAAAADARA